MAKKRKKRRRGYRKKKPVILKIKDETIHSVIAIVFFLIGILIFVSFATGQGELLSQVNNFLAAQFGTSMLFIPFIFFSAGLVMLRANWRWSRPNVLLGTLLLMVGVMGFLQSGRLGSNIFVNLEQLISPLGSYIFYFSLLLIGLFIMLQLSFSEIAEIISRILGGKKPEKLSKEEQKNVKEEIKKARGFKLPKLFLPFGKKDKAFSVNESGSLGKDASLNTGGTAVLATGSKIDKVNKDGLSDNTLNASAQLVWEYPPLSLLSSAKGGKADRGDVKANAQIIEGTLESFGVRAKVAEVNYGPSVTQYALEITRGTKLSRITGLSTDLALALAAPTGRIRIEAPIAGRSLVGVEVPNHSAEFVTLRQMLSSADMKKHSSKLAVALGIDVSGRPMIADVAQMPHLLIAGATGSGKSVAINSFLCSILFRASPAEVKLILIDPKRVELTGYNNIPHLLTPVIVEPAKVVSALKWATHEMDKRYKQLAEVGVKNIVGYNELAGFAAMPNILIIIDELADIMLFSPSEVEESVTRIAQMARAVGIHLILSTQRPSVDVITGLIKANISSRIAFNVSSMTDSRVILDMQGAEKLLGRGDMLFIPPTRSTPLRLQGTFVTESETKKLIDFLKAHGQKPEFKEEITHKFKANVVKGGSGGNMGEDRDAFFTDAVRLFSQYDKASSSLIQRRLKVGYARAARILDQLYEAGMVGPPEGSKPREVNQQQVGEFLASTQSVE